VKNNGEKRKSKASYGEMKMTKAHRRSGGGASVAKISRRKCGNVAASMKSWRRKSAIVSMSAAEKLSGNGEKQAAWQRQWRKQYRNMRRSENNNGSSGVAIKISSNRNGISVKAEESEENGESGSGEIEGVASQPETGGEIVSRKLANRKRKQYSSVSVMAMASSGGANGSKAKINGTMA
jgi:hypothetical protein